MLIRLILVLLFISSCSNLLDEDAECSEGGEKCLSSLSFVSGLSSSSVKVKDPRVIFKINVSDMDEKGILENGAQILPITDIVKGGNSVVMDPFENILGNCPNSYVGCEPNWDFSKAVNEETDGSQYLYSKLKVSDFVPDIDENKVWPQGGWEVVPYPGVKIIDGVGSEKAKSMSLTDSSWITIRAKIPKNEQLEVEFLEEGGATHWNDFYSSSPKHSLRSNDGEWQVYHFPVIYAWRKGGVDTNKYDVTKASSIALTYKANIVWTLEADRGEPRAREFSFDCMIVGASENFSDGCDFVAEKQEMFTTFKTTFELGNKWNYMCNGYEKNYEITGVKLLGDTTIYEIEKTVRERKSKDSLIIYNEKIIKLTDQFASLPINLKWQKSEGLYTTYQNKEWDGTSDYIQKFYTVADTLDLSIFKYSSEEVFGWDETGDNLLSIRNVLYSEQFGVLKGEPPLGGFGGCELADVNFSKDEFLKIKKNTLFSSF